MTTLLLRLFVKDYRDTENPSVRARYGVFSGALGIILNLCLFGGKFIAGFISGSIAITADAFNNLTDAGSSVLTLIGFRLAGQKPDLAHPFGHGRIEYLAGFAISMVILLTGVELGKSSVSKIFAAEIPRFSWLPAAILIASILVKLYMFAFNRRLSRDIRSAAMGATAIDSLSDVVATTVVLLGSVIGQLAHVAVDGYLGLLVAGFILYSGYRAAKETLSPLLGQPADPELVDGIAKTVLSHEHVVGMHDLIIHDYGPGRCMVSLHAEVPHDGDILELHNIIDDIERDLTEEFNCHAVIHMDPVVHDDEETVRMRTRVAALVKLIDPDMTIHDFRMTRGAGHKNLIFDVIAPYRCKRSDAEIVASIKGAVLALSDETKYYAVVTVDHPF